MKINRKEDLSIYYWLKDLFIEEDWITIHDGFPEATLTTPTIAVERAEIDSSPYEMGNRKRMQDHIWFMDIFALNKSQRDEIGFTIMEALDDDIPVYDYDEGFPPDVSPTQIGCLEVSDYNMKIVRVMPELVEKMYYRASITLQARYSIF